MDAALSEYDPSPANLTTLKRTEQTWTEEVGWACINPPDDDAVAEAINAGIMFAEPRELDHDGWVTAVRSAVAQVSTQAVSEASPAAAWTSGRYSAPTRSLGYCPSIRVPSETGNQLLRVRMVGPRPG
jgi:hypothetical protein